MELYHLRTFIAVAEEKNLTRAAQKLFTSPPSVSPHIKALEEELNVELFIRTPRGMHLTEAGETLKQKAESTVYAADDFVNSAQTLCDQPLGCVGMSVIEKRLAETSDRIIIWETDPVFCDLNFAHLKSRADEPLIRAITEQVTTLWQSEPQLAIS